MTASTPTLTQPARRMCARARRRRTYPISCAAPWKGARRRGLFGPDKAGPSLPRLFRLPWQDGRAARRRGLFGLDKAGPSLPRLFRLPWQDGRAARRRGLFGPDKAGPSLPRLFRLPWQDGRAARRRGLLLGLCWTVRERPTESKMRLVRILHALNMSTSGPSVSR